MLLFSVAFVFGRIGPITRVMRHIELQYQQNMEIGVDAVLLVIRQLIIKTEMRMESASTRR